MKSVVVAIALPLISLAMEPKVQQVTIENRSQYKVKVCYMHETSKYCAIKAGKSENLAMPLPQKISFYIKPLAFLQEAMINSSQFPIFIGQVNSVGVTQNAQPLCEKIYFRPSNPSLAIYKKDSTD